MAAAQADQRAAEAELTAARADDAYPGIKRVIEREHQGFGKPAPSMFAFDVGADFLGVFDVIDEHIDHTLHQYFSQCSLLVTSRDLAMMGATLANMGTNPVTGEDAFETRYVRDVLASLARPVMELQGFQRITLAPGESRDVTFTVGPEQLKMLDEKMEWTVEPGEFRLMIGASSKDIRLRGILTVK